MVENGVCEGIDVVKDNFNSITSPLYIIAGTAVLLLLYFGKSVVVTLLVTVLLAFVLEPIVELQERIYIVRPLGSALALVVLSLAIYSFVHFSYLKTMDFIDELPQYTTRIKEQMDKLRKKTQRLEETRKAIMPEKPEDRNAVKVKTVDSSFTAELGAGSVIAGETLLYLSFIPFMAYFMLTWSDHIRDSFVKLFHAEHRQTVKHALRDISHMLRSFILGNIIIGVILGVISAGVFWALGVPYWYFIGFISGMLSLAPYLGVALALVPPLAAGLGVLSARSMIAAALTVLIVHLFGLNVLYPKILGKRLQLNPLMVTLSLLFWGFLWGGMGLLLAIPITAAMKIVFDHVDGLNPWGELLGGKE